MSHYHMELILPPQPDREAVRKASHQILLPFREEQDPLPEDEYHEIYEGHRFWDWYVIGGRWTRDHIVARLDETKLQDFWDNFAEAGMEGPGFQMPGSHPQLTPESVLRAHELWADFFPNDECPFWQKDGRRPGEACDHKSDICTVGELGENAGAYRLLIATLDGHLKYKAAHLISTSFWNSVSWQDAKWEGDVHQAIGDYNGTRQAEIDRRRDKDGVADEWSLKYGIPSLVGDDWHAVTVDYHS